MRVAAIMIFAVACAAPQDRAQRAPAAARSPSEFDLIIAGGDVLDGTGSPAVRAEGVERRARRRAGEVADRS